MKRTSLILIVVAALSLMSLLYGHSQTQGDSRTASRLPTVKSVQVNSRTIAKLPKDKNYVVDMTQRGVTYEFDNKTSRVDLSRVFVRSSVGEVAIASYLEKAFPKEKLSAFKLSSQSFSIGTRPLGNVVTPPSAILNFGCDKAVCSCSGKKDCTDLIFNTSLCGSVIICSVQSNGQKTCICARI